MRDNDLIRLFRPIIIAGLADRGIEDATVKQAYQPTQQGINTNPCVYFFKVGDRRYGFLKRSDVWDEDESVMVHTERQRYETTFQINALVRQNPGDTAGFTASDIVNIVSDILQSDSTIKILQNAEVGILRITEVRNPYFMDDRDQFEASPSFDFVLLHNQDYITTTPIVERTEFGIYRV
jgi:hypothetical protein